jgi:hypothetical protein
MDTEQNSETVVPVDPASLGLRPVTRWVPDTRDPAFIERYRKQCAILAASARARAEFDWWERLQTDDGWV